MTRKWTSRVVEEANLFNPAYCATLLAVASKDYAKKTERPLPFALALLILPIVLHEKTREELPHSTITALMPWLQKHKPVLVGFNQRVAGLRPATQEAVMFGISQGALILDGAALKTTSKYIAPTPARTDMFTKETTDTVEAAGFLGRWFANAGTTSTIYAAWGVSP